MADAVHEVLVDLAADALARDVRRAFRSVRAAGVIDRSFAREGFVDELVGLVDAVRDFRDDDVLAVETAHGDVLVGRDDDAVGLRDFRARQDVLRAAGAVRFHFDRNAALLRVLFEALGRHERVGDARRAGRDGEDLDVVGGGGDRRRALADELAVFFLVDDGEELVLRLRCDERFLEVVVHDHRRELLQDGQMLVVRALRRGDHEEEARRLAVHGVVVAALRHGHGREAGGFDARRFRMRRREAVAEPRRALLLAREDVLLVLCFVDEVAACFHEVRELVDRRLLAGRRSAELDALGLEEIGDSHCA